MPFFSFIAKDNNYLINDLNIKQNNWYFSKSTLIWKKINQIKVKKSFIINQEKLIKISSLGKNILFFLPPNIGLGDAIEYAHALKAIKDKKYFNSFGIAFTQSYTFIFEKYFALENIYPLFISDNQIKKYQTLFHFTLEVIALRNQKIVRSNIEKEILDYFKIEKIKNFKIKTKTIRTIKKISIFPISNSPIRTMPKKLLMSLILNLIKDYSLDIYINSHSEISNLLIEGLDKKKIKLIDCKNHNELVKSIKHIEYGVFMDSGPLHVANLFDKRGILIESTVSSKILLKPDSKIVSIKNNYSSFYCKSPCGLTDLFNLKNNIGCYDSLKIKKSTISKNNLLPSVHFRNVKNNYTRFIKVPVQCLHSLNIQNIITYINKDLSL